MESSTQPFERYSYLSGVGFRRWSLLWFEDVGVWCCCFSALGARNVEHDCGFPLDLGMGIEIGYQNFSMPLGVHRTFFECYLVRGKPYLYHPPRPMKALNQVTCSGRERGISGLGQMLQWLLQILCTLRHRLGRQWHHTSALDAW